MVISTHRHIKLVSVLEKPRIKKRRNFVYTYVLTPDSFSHSMCSSCKDFERRFLVTVTTRSRSSNPRSLQYNRQTMTGTNPNKCGTFTCARCLVRERERVLDQQFVNGRIEITNVYKKLFFRKMTVYLKPSCPNLFESRKEGSREERKKKGKKKENGTVLYTKNSCSFFSIYRGM